MTSPSRTSLTLSAAAISYAERGWRVFPLKEGQKTPLTRTGFKVATCDPALIQAWWEHWPNANIGLATGHTFDVLDVDGPDGVAALRAFWKERDIAYHHTGPISLTGKGWHYLFATTERGNGAAMLGEDSKLDFRGLGGYIVAPPSLHPLGHHSTWDERRGVDLPLPEPPEWLIELVDRTSTGPKATPKKVIVPGIDATVLRAMDQNRSITVEAAALAARQSYRDVSIELVCESKGIALRQHGRYLQGLCPFHGETTPSFTVYPENNTFYCYGCGAYGDSDDLAKDTHFALKRAPQ